MLSKEQEMRNSYQRSMKFLLLTFFVSLLAYLIPELPFYMLTLPISYYYLNKHRRLAKQLDNQKELDKNNSVYYHLPFMIFMPLLTIREIREK